MQETYASLAVVEKQASILLMRLMVSDTGNESKQ